MSKRLYLKDKIIDNIIIKLHAYECVKSQVDLNLINSINDRFIRTVDSNSEHLHQFINRIIYIELNEIFHKEQFKPGTN